MTRKTTNHLAKFEKKMGITALEAAELVDHSILDILRTKTRIVTGETLVELQKMIQDNELPIPAKLAAARNVIDVFKIIELSNQLPLKEQQQFVNVHVIEAELQNKYMKSQDTDLNLGEQNDESN